MYLNVTLGALALASVIVALLTRRQPPPPGFDKESDNARLLLIASYSLLGIGMVLIVAGGILGRMQLTAAEDTAQPSWLIEISLVVILGAVLATARRNSGWAAKLMLGLALLLPALLWWAEYLTPTPAGSGPGYAEARAAQAALLALIGFTIPGLITSGLLWGNARGVRRAAQTVEHPPAQR